MSVEQGAFIGSVFLAVFSMALEARVYDRLAGKAARPECHRFVSINRLQAILKHVLRFATSCLRYSIEKPEQRPEFW